MVENSFRCVVSATFSHSDSHEEKNDFKRQNLFLIFVMCKLIIFGFWTIGQTTLEDASSCT